MLKGSVINITSSPMRSQSNIGKVTVNFVSHEIVHMIEFLRIFVLKKSSFSCFKISLQTSVKETRHVDGAIKQIRSKKTFPLPLL